MKRFLLVILSIIFIGGCASGRQAQLEEFYRSLESNINVMTYDQAIVNWGQPASIVEGEDITLVTWGSQTSGSLAVPLMGMTATMPVSHGWELQLTFNKTTNRMVYWKYREW